MAKANAGSIASPQPGLTNPFLPRFSRLLLTSPLQIRLPVDTDISRCIASLCSRIYGISLLPPRSDRWWQNTSRPNRGSARAISSKESGQKRRSLFISAVRLTSSFPKLQPEFNGSNNPRPGANAVSALVNFKLYQALVADKFIAVGTAAMLSALLGALAFVSLSAQPDRARRSSWCRTCRSSGPNRAACGLRRRRHHRPE
jgi:hypothetical protein